MMGRLMLGLGVLVAVSAPGAATAFELAEVQGAVAAHEADSWLLCDFRGSSPSARRILGMGEDTIATRRWCYVIPASGEPLALVHAIEPGVLDHLPGEKVVYRSWQEWEAGVKRLATHGGAAEAAPAPEPKKGKKGRRGRRGKKGKRGGSAKAGSGPKTVAMGYSPKGAIPYADQVPAGLLELVKSAGVKVVSDAALVQRFESVLSAEALESHRKAARIVRGLIGDAMRQASMAACGGAPVSEYELQQFLAEQMRGMGLSFDHAPIVAVGKNAADPHYEPTEAKSDKIDKGALLLIDAWGKSRKGVYADITRMGYLGATVPEEHAKVFKTVVDAQKAALFFINSELAFGKAPKGSVADSSARAVIKRAGYADNFLHRTGHSITTDVHGNGAHLDSLETNDTRGLLPNTCFSIEPGIYLSGKAGYRSEIDVCIIEEGGKLKTEVTTDPRQKEIETFACP